MSGILGKNQKIDFDDDDVSRGEQMESFDDHAVNSCANDKISDIIRRRYDRRSVLKGMFSFGALAAVGTSIGSFSTLHSTAEAKLPPNFGNQDLKPSFTFPEIQGGIDGTHHVAKGYDAEIFLRWGDPIFADSPAFDPYKQTVSSQLKQFGYNNDFIGFFPLDKALGKEGEGRALLCVNHEYTIDELMFPDLGDHRRYNFTGITEEMVDIEMAAHGGTIIEIAQQDGHWKPVLSSPYNRRINAFDTKMTLDGPAAGHGLLKTSDDPEGRNVIGTINNCAGGITPWGTYLMSEENFHLNFYTDQVKRRSGKPQKNLGGDQVKGYKRYKIPGQFHAWGRFHERFNVDMTPNEPNRFGWVVEVDILNPTSAPVKHTAMGRFCHEGCENIISKGGHVVVYMGDDTKFEYLYKFVSKHKYQPDEGDQAIRQKNLSLLSEGILYVARFNDDGSLDWLPLIHGQNGLIAENGFPSQAEVLIYARMAADQLGATPMDRPEDVEPGQDGKVYVMLTNNSKRTNQKPKRKTNNANPREKNYFGHIIELKEFEQDHASLRATWNIVVQCGDPAKPDVKASWHRDTTKDGWFGSPDNCAVDAKGRLWVATDQGSAWARTGKADGLYAMETKNGLSGLSKMFFRVPVGAELCGPRFTPDLETLFLSVQHPASDGVRHYAGFNRNSTFADPATRWPDFDDKMPPRPSVVMITKKGGGQIG